MKKTKYRHNKEYPGMTDVEELVPNKQMVGGKNGL